MLDLFYSAFLQLQETETFRIIYTNNKSITHIFSENVIVHTT